MLTRQQRDRFWRDGYLLVENGLTPDQLSAAKSRLDGWVEESRDHDKPFGPPTLDDRPRFDMGDEHSTDRPALRRVNNPSDICPVFEGITVQAPVIDMVADLIGPDVKFHHCKINQKLPGSRTEVLYHQDFTYTPHTNDDVITVLMMLDDMDLENGCLTVVPGSHRGAIESLYDGDTFTGFISPEVEKSLESKKVAVTGKAGSACLMHTRVLHGSEANRSDHPRGLYIAVFTAADAFPLARNPMANPNEGRIVRGRKTRTARLKDMQVELPEQPKSASFFTVQGQKSKKQSKGTGSLEPYSS